MMNLFKALASMSTMELFRQLDSLNLILITTLMLMWYLFLQSQMLNVI